jgi:UDP-glucuronate 4-epimerase
VRDSLENPRVYIKSNINAFLNILEAVRNYNIKDLVYASSSSVYGSNQKVPFSVNDSVDNPISLYAATKKADELMAHTYSHLFKINTTGLRFFTVIGPYGRPDMAPILFASAIFKGEEIKVFNFGKMKRDFTYIDDIVEGILLALEKTNGYQIFNLGNNKPVELEYFISCIEKEIGKTAKKKYMELQPGDVLETFADIEHTKEVLGWEPKTSTEEAIKAFIGWYKEYYGDK